jgi:CheY-like chemotaxis protein
MVLLIDDDEATAYAMVRRLSLRGYASVAAASASDALRLLAQRGEPPFAIVLDLRMPGIGGLDALRVIRRNPELATVPVIVYSAYLEEGVDREAMAAGATECVTKGKPPGDDLLFATLDRYLPPR